MKTIIQFSLIILLAALSLCAQPLVLLENMEKWPLPNETAQYSCPIEIGKAVANTIEKVFLETSSIHKMKVTFESTPTPEHAKKNTYLLSGPTVALFNRETESYLGTLTKEKTTSSYVFIAAYGPNTPIRNKPPEVAFRFSLENFVNFCRLYPSLEAHVIAQKSADAHLWPALGASLLGAAALAFLTELIRKKGKIKDFSFLASLVIATGIFSGAPIVGLSMMDLRAQRACMYNLIALTLTPDIKKHKNPYLREVLLINGYDHQLVQEVCYKHKRRNAHPNQTAAKKYEKLIGFLQTKSALINFSVPLDGKEGTINTPQQNIIFENKKAIALYNEKEEKYIGLLAQRAQEYFWIRPKQGIVVATPLNREELIGLCKQIPTLKGHEIEPGGAAINPLKTAFILTSVVMAPERCPNDVFSSCSNTYDSFNHAILAAYSLNTNQERQK